MHFRIRLCISGVLAILFYMAGIRILPNWVDYSTHKWNICMALLTAGAILWPLGLAVNASIADKKRFAQKHRDIFDEHKTETDPPFLLFDLAYWGLMLIFFSAIVVLIPAASDFASEVVMARDHSPAVRPRPTRSPIEPAAEATSKTTAAPPPEATVSLKLQGLIYRPSNASALIDGQTYFVGDNVGKAKVVAIEPSRVLLQQDGVVKILELGK